MEIKFSLNLPIKAMPKDNHYKLPKEKLDVRDIDMGQYNTSVKIMGYTDKCFNSIHFDFYLHNRKIDIYKSGLINRYRTLSLPGIYYMED